MSMPSIAELNETLEAIGISDLSTEYQKVRLLDAAWGAPRTLRKQDPAASSYQLATLESIALPDHLKAASIVRACVRAPAGMVGELTPVAHDVTPSTTQIAVAPNGDIVVLASDLITDLDVTYIPEKGIVVEETVTPTAGIYTIPTKYSSRGIIALLEAEAIAGTVTGKKIVLAPASGHSLPATTKACLGDLKTTILFNNATDAVTSARVKYLVTPDVP